MPLLTATRGRRTAEAHTKRFRKLERILDEMGESIASEAERLRNSYDSIAATAAFSVESMENGDTSPWLANQARVLGASLVWHADRLASLRNQGNFVETARGALKALMARDAGKPVAQAADAASAVQIRRSDAAWTA